MIYIIVFMAVVFLTTLAVVLTKFYFSDTRRMTSVTEGRVVSTEERVVIDRDVRRTETEVLASYTAWGKEFQVKRVLDGARGRLFPPGRVVRVRYNPGEPDMSQLMV